jgi:hypothetical protein
MYRDEVGLMLYTQPCVENLATGHREIIGTMFDMVFPDSYRHAINSFPELEMIKRD